MLVGRVLSESRCHRLSSLSSSESSCLLVGWLCTSFRAYCYLESKISLTSAFRYPVYSFFLPFYSFWRMDEFGWGTTRIVLDDGKNKKVVTDANEMKFNESMIPYKKWSGQWHSLTIDWRAFHCASRV